MRISAVCFYSVLLVLVSRVQCQELSFMVLGDWGGKTLFPYTTPIQLRVADSMATVAASINAQFVVTVGDNFYDLGIQSCDDPRWQTSYEQVYHHPSLQIPWYVVAGNRDYYGNVTAQLEYTKLSNRWIFPSLNYDRVFSIPNTNATVHFIAVNSFDITSSSRREIGSPAFDPALQYVVIDQLTKKLVSSKSEWKVFVTHYPIWSAGAHGPNDPDLIQVLEPILLKWKPDIYLSGHDHSLQHLVVNGINYYVVGGGSDASDSWIGAPGLPADSLKFNYPPPRVSIGGFGSVTITQTSLTVTIYDDMGRPLYTNVHYPQPPSPPSTPTPPPVNNTTPTPTTSPQPSFNLPLLTNKGGSVTETYSIVFGILAVIVFLAIVITGVITWRIRSKETDNL